jgi:hypothetical protein
MATCATCNKSFTFGGVKDGEVRYCSATCQFQDFMGRLMAALAQAAANLPPAPEAAHAVQAGAPEAPLPEVDPEAADTSPVVALSNDLLVLLIGSGVALLVAGLIYVLVDLIGYPFHAQTFWFVVPVGALLCGMVAGGGFWGALRLLDRLPTAGTFITAGLVGVASYVLIYVLMWLLLEVQGMPVPQQVSFGTFLQFVIEHQRLRLARGGDREGFEVGKFGYVRFALNVAGFAAGMLAMVAIAGGKVYCRQCKRYYQTVGRQIRASSDPEALATMLHPAIAALQAGRVQEALQVQGASGTAAAKGYWTTTIKVEACPGCGLHLATLTATVPGERGTQEVQGFTFQGRTYDAVRLFN